MPLTALVVQGISPYRPSPSPSASLLASSLRSSQSRSPSAPDRLSPLAASAAGRVPPLVLTTARGVAPPTRRGRRHFGSVSGGTAPSPFATSSACARPPTRRPAPVVKGASDGQDRDQPFPLQSDRRLRRLAPMLRGRRRRTGLDRVGSSNDDAAAFDATTACPIAAISVFEKGGIDPAGGSRRRAASPAPVQPDAAKRGLRRRLTLVGPALPSLRRPRCRRVPARRVDESWLLLRKGSYGRPRHRARARPPRRRARSRRPHRGPDAARNFASTMPFSRPSPAATAPAERLFRRPRAADVSDARALHDSSVRSRLVVVGSSFVETKIC